jgi:hypothetical protein
MKMAPSVFVSHGAPTFALASDTAALLSMESFALGISPPGPRLQNFPTV